MESSSEKIENIRNSIQRYLDKHPQASDTVEGVMVWLERQNFDDTLSLVKKVLDQLVEEGTLSRLVQMNGREIFSVPSKIKSSSRAK